MDFISVLIASIIFSFFASNYFYKYKEEKVKKDYIELFVYIGFIFEIFIIVGIAMSNLFVIYLFFCLLLVLLVIQFCVGIGKINYLNKNRNNKSNLECALIGIRNIFYVLGAILLVPQHIMYLIYNKLFK